MDWFSKFLLILFGAFFSSFYPELYVHHFFFISGNGLLAYTAFKWRELSLVTLNLTLTYLDNDTKEEVQLLAVSNPHIVVEDYYGNIFLCGYENGCELTGGTIVTGAAAGDLSGFTLTFEGQEEKAPYFVDAGVVSGSATQITPN